MTDFMPVMLPAQIPPCDGRGGRPSASGLERLRLCPGSWRAELLCPEEAEGADAATGTRLHKHMEDGTLPEDAAEAEAVQWCQESVRNLAGGYLEAAAEVYKEVRWWCRDKSFSGQPDYVAVDGCGRVLIVDYKFGRGEVPAATKNLQLAALAVLALDNLSGVGEVYAAILQPFAGRRAPEVVRYTPEDLEQARAYIGKLLSAAEADDAPLRAGEAQCKYCKAAPACPACRMMLMRVTGGGMLPWSRWSPAQKRQAYDLAKLADKWQRKVMEAVKADLQDGREIPGLVLGGGSAKFEVQDAQGAFALLSGNLGVTGDEFAGCCKVKLTELDKLVHAKLKERDGAQKVMQSREYVRGLLAGVAKVSTTAGSVQEQKGGKR